MNRYTLLTLLKKVCNVRSTCEIVVLLVCQEVIKETTSSLMFAQTFIIVTRITCAAAVSFIVVIANVGVGVGVGVSVVGGGHV